MKSPATRIRKAPPLGAREQADWIVALEPWRSLGYQRRPFAAWLARCARTGDVLFACRGRKVLGVAITRSDFLLGVFIALLVVRSEARGLGIGRGLVEHVAARLGRRRWLYTSSDSRNRAAARFYRSLGFERVGRLPDLIRPGRAEILWRRVCAPGR